jgi:folate-binding protein YgfZ
MSTVADRKGRELLAELHEAAGAAMDEVHGTRVPLHYGDLEAEYRAVLEAGVVVDRSHRAFLPVEGRQPARMLTGVVSGTMPPEPTYPAEGIREGRAPYSLVLTPKGKVVTDLRLFRLEAGEGGAHLMDVPAAGHAGLMEHLTRYLPPRFARVTEPPEPLGLLTVVGPRAAEVLSREVLGLRVGDEELEDLDEGDERVLEDGSRLGIRVVRNTDVHPTAFDVLAAAASLKTFWSRMIELGFHPAGLKTWDTLRIEKGRPAYGVELDRDTIPPEAGVVGRAIDHQKGCYTGQEVIVRVRDRGRVNRHLRGLLLGDLPEVEPGASLFIPGRDRPAGEIRSVTASPRFGQGAALGYLRREAEPPTVARLGAPDGPEVQVRALTDEGWDLVEGDPGLSG